LVVPGSLRPFGCRLDVAELLKSLAVVEFPVLQLRVDVRVEVRQLLCQGCESSLVRSISLEVVLFGRDTRVDRATAPPAASATEVGPPATAVGASAASSVSSRCRRSCDVVRRRL